MIRASHETKAKILRLYESGRMPLRRIAQECGVCLSTVDRMARRARIFRTARRCRGIGKRLLRAHREAKGLWRLTAQDVDEIVAGGFPPVKRTPSTPADAGKDKR